MSLADELERLRTLRDSGALTEAEFEQAKAAVLNGPPAATASAEEPPRGHRIGMAIACLHINAVLHLIVAFLFVAFTSDPYPERVRGVWEVIHTLTLAYSVAFAVGMVVIVYGLKRRRFWAWVAGLCVFGLDLPSIFLPLGAFGLWGLLDPGSRAEFGMGCGVRKAEPATTPPPAEQRVVSAEVALPKFPKP